MQKIYINILIFTLGFLVAIAIFAPHAFAKDLVNKVFWYRVDTLDTFLSMHDVGKVIKTYDEETNVVCYSVQAASGGGGISCLKNN